MSILHEITDEKLWREFYALKEEQNKMRQGELKALLDFIDGKGYLSIALGIERGSGFSLPTKHLINKVGSTRKRVVYTYSDEENYVLKLITRLLYKYDGAFAGNLYSFRRNFGVKRAFSKLTSCKNIGDMYSYKVDIHDYFNSADVDICVSELCRVIEDDKPLLEFITRLLTEDRVVYEGNTIHESHGIMAGVPIASFLANVYLRKMDIYFEQNNIIYARYSDDIIVFAESADELERHITAIKDFLSRYKLEINPEKEVITKPGQPWVFLGIKYFDGKIDIAPVSVDKVKAKFKRKANALLRWKRKKNLQNIHAVKGFIKYINRFYYDNRGTDEMTWTKWYFPIINTDESLKVLDGYALEQIRYIYSEKHSKASYNFRYEQIKELGYKPLVSAYYSEKQDVR